ncbi:MAG: peptidylprolyl isomerase [Paludibacteraceae bacterium]
MATLQSIRNKGVLLAVIIGLALLAFIIGDFLNSGSTLFKQSKRNVAEVAGEKIDIETYQKAIDQMNTVYKIEYGRNDFNENELSQMRSQVWESLVNEKILQAEAAKMGLSVSKEELTDRLIGKNIHPMILQRRAFADPQTGQFSKTALLQFYNSVFSDDATQKDQEQLKEAKSYWLFWENAVKNSILQEKYIALIGKAVGVNKIEAKYNYDSRKLTGNVNYVVQPYMSVSDSTVKVSNDELKQRYDKEKELFKQEDNRSINYVAFDVAPLQEDFKEAQAWIAKVSDEFKKTDDVVGLVNAESDISYTGENYSPQTVPANLKDFAFANATGAVFGPVFQNNTYTMARVMESGIMESDSVKLRMIVLPPNDDKKADSIVNAIKAGAAFTEMVTKYSAPQAAANGGEVGWITKKMVGKEIADPAFSKATNEIFKVSSAQGTQIFQIMEKTPARPKVKLAILQRKVTPSNQSYGKIFNEAKQFAVGSTDAKKFEELAKQKGYVIRPAVGLMKSSDNVDAIPQSRQIVRWAFENSKGTISDVFDCDRNTYVVATVTEVNEKGYRSLAQVTPQLKAQIIKDKKADIIKKQLSSLLAKNPTLEGLAAALGTQVKTAPSVNFASFQFGDAGPEPYVIGKATVTAENKITAPLKGESGVYVIQPLAKQADPTPFNAKLEAAQLDGRTIQTLPYIIMQKLREKYEVVDNRFNFY